MTELINEYRAEFQIPSYISDTVIQGLLEQSIAWAAGLSPESSYSNDTTCKELILNRTFYAYNHQLADFESDFERNINTWLFGKVGGAE